MYNTRANFSCSSPVYSVIDDFAQAEKEGVADSIIKQVRKVLQQAKDGLLKDPKSLALQIVGRLQHKTKPDVKGDSITQLVNQAKEIHFEGYITQNGNIEIN